MSASPLLIVLRGAHVAALLSAFGILLYLRTMPVPAGVRLESLFRWSAALALVLGVGWLAAEAGSVAGAAGPAGAFASIPGMLTYFAFGRVLAARLLLLAVLCLLPIGGRGGLAGLVIAAVAVGLQPLLGHAGATPGLRGGAVFGCEIIHLLAAGAWAGGLLPLQLGVRRMDSDEAARLLRRFSRLGMIAVTAIAITGLVQLGLLTRGFVGLLGSAYGTAMAAKLALFIVAMGFALLNRAALTPRLSLGRSGPTRRALSASLWAEAGTAAGIVLAAAWLASSAPGG